MQKRPHILIVEDEVVQMEYIKSYFSRRGFIVSQTTDGLEALAFIKRKKPDIVLLDLTLGSGLNGKAILERLRQFDKETRVIVLTGNFLIDDKEVQSLRCLGISRFLYKPVDLEKLEEIVKEIVGISDIALPKIKANAPTPKRRKLSSLIHDLSNTLGVIRNKCENFKLNVEEEIYKDKSKKELIKISMEVMATVVRKVDRAMEAVRKISNQVKK